MFRVMFAGRQRRLGISVIIPAFNAEATLEQALHSLRAQSFKDWEAIVVDDGSNDKTAQIAADWSRQDRRIRLHRLKKNTGESAARNAGLTMAAEELVLFLDSDDWIGEDHLDRLRAAFLNDPKIELAFSHVTLVSYDGKPIQIVKTPPADWISYHMIYGCPFVTPSCCLISRRICLEVGNFDAALNIGEDWDFWQRVVRIGIRFAAVPTASAFYRQHPFSAMHKSTYSFESIITLIERAHARIGPNNQGECGVSGELSSNEILKGVFYQVVWHTGHRIATERDVDCALSYAPHTKIEGVTSEDVVNGLALGIVQGAGVILVDLASKWPHFRSALAVVIDRICDCLLDRPTVEDIQARLDRHLIDAAGPDAAPLSVGQMHAIRWRLEDGWPKEVKARPEIKVLRIWMTAGGALIGIVDVPVGASGSASPPPCLAAFTHALPGRSLIRILWALHGTGRRRELLQLFGRGKTQQLARDLLKLSHDQRRTRIVSFIAENVDIALK